MDGHRKERGDLRQSHGAAQFEEEAADWKRDVGEPGLSLAKKRGKKPERRETEKVQFAGLEKRRVPASREEGLWSCAKTVRFFGAFSSAGELASSSSVARRLYQF